MLDTGGFIKAKLIEYSVTIWLDGADNFSKVGILQYDPIFASGQQKFDWVRRVLGLPPGWPLGRVRF